MYRRDTEQILGGDHRGRPAGAGVDWAAGTPGRIAVGRAARVDDILAAIGPLAQDALSCTLQ